MMEANKRIVRVKVGIKEPLKVRKGMTGALVLEVGDIKAPIKTNRLTARFREIAEERGDFTRIQRPAK